LTAGPNATRVAPSGVHRSKGTDAAKASRRETGGTPDPDHAGAPRRIRRLDVLRCAGSRRARSPGGTAPKERRPACRSRVRGNGAEARGQPCDDVTGAGGITAVMARILLLQFAPRCGTTRPRLSVAVAGVAVAPRGGRTGGASALHAWPATAGGGVEAAQRRQRAQPGFGLEVNDVDRLVPPIRGGTWWNLWTKPRSRPPALRCGSPCAGSASRTTRTAHLGAVGSDRGRQRQEGNGRSDAVRLSARGMLRRV
jgi:hypothetical protein